jgi:hypothetical protein
MTSRYWLTPPDLRLQVQELLDRETFFDPCPYPRQVDALTIPWEKPWYCNPPFEAKDGSPTLFARKAISEGGPGVFVVSIQSPVAELLNGGARFITARRIAWLETETKKPKRNPNLTGVFYLPRDQQVEIRYSQNGVKCEDKQGGKT